jgi:hypothetical protein
VLIPLTNKLKPKAAAATPTRSAPATQSTTKATPKPASARAPVKEEIGLAPIDDLAPLPDPTPPARPALQPLPPAPQGVWQQPQAPQPVYQQPPAPQPVWQQPPVPQAPGFAPLQPLAPLTALAPLTPLTPIGNDPLGNLPLGHAAAGNFFGGAAPVPDPYGGLTPLGPPPGADPYGGLMPLGAPQANDPFGASPYGVPPPSAFGGASSGRALPPAPISSYQAPAATYSDPGTALILPAIFQLIATAPVALATMWYTLLIIYGMFTAFSLAAELGIKIRETAILYGVMRIIIGVIVSIAQLVVIFGSIKQLQRREFDQVMTANWLSVIVPILPFSFPFGIWSLILLHQDAVRRSFRRS